MRAEDILRLLTDDGRFFLALAFDLHHMNNAQRYNVDKAVTDVRGQLYFTQSSAATGCVDDARGFVDNSPEVSGRDVFFIDKIRRIFEAGSDGVFRAALEAVRRNHHKVKTEHRKEFLFHDDWLG